MNPENERGHLPVEGGAPENQSLAGDVNTGIVPRCKPFAAPSADDPDKYATLAYHVKRVQQIVAAIEPENFHERNLLSLAIDFLRCASLASEIEGLDEFDPAWSNRWCALWNELTDSAEEQHLLVRRRREEARERAYREFLKPLYEAFAKEGYTFGGES